jgi:hypothetical protein
MPFQATPNVSQSTEKVGLAKKTQPKLRGAIEDDNLGDWNTDMLKKCVLKNTSSVCSQPLKKVASSFLPINSLKALGEFEIPVFDDKGTQNKHKKRSQFFVEIGHKDAHIKAFEERSDAIDNFSTFDEIVVDFFTKLFTSDETTHIESVLKSDNLICCIVWCYYNDQIDTSVTVKLKIASAVIFRVTKDASPLLYLGTVQLKMSEFVPKITKKKLDKKKDILLQGQKLGILMIALVQKVSFAAFNHHKIICQVNSQPKNGALNFYLRLWFQKHSKKEEFVVEQLEMHKDVFISEGDLTWIGSRCAVYLVYPWWIQNQANSDYISIALSAGKTHILKYKEPDKNSDKVKLFKDVRDVIGNTNFNCKVTLDETLYSKSSPVTGNKTSATVEGLATILKERNANIMIETSKQDPSKPTKPTHRNYKTMSEILFDNANRYDDIRCFLNYIIFAMSLMAKKGNKLLSDDIPEFRAFVMTVYMHGNYWKMFLPKPNMMPEIFLPNRTCNLVVLQHPKIHLTGFISFHINKFVLKITNTKVENLN